MYKIYQQFSQTTQGVFLPVVTRALSGSAFVYSRNQAMIKAILTEAQQGHSESNEEERAVLLGVIQNLAAALWVDCPNFNDFDLLCKSVEQQRLGLEASNKKGGKYI